MIRIVLISESARRELGRVPHHISRKLWGWVKSVKRDGLEAASMLPGYHDEPLKGKWSGFRSIRLSRNYRALYRLLKKNGATAILIAEVNRHEY